MALTAMVTVTAIIHTARIGLEIALTAGMAAQALEGMEDTAHTADMQTKATTLRVGHTMAISEEEEEADEGCVITMRLIHVL